MLVFVLYAFECPDGEFGNKRVAYLSYFDR